MFHNLSNSPWHHPRQRRHLIRAIVGVGINNIYKPKFPPTAVAKLLQYSGSRVEHKDEFSSDK